ncbi:MAG TPA: glycosyltransferase family 1 protein [Spirochaetota bacterium]|nr:glycosyltransferase family 1 protein [Spirochaetota bacterium]
MKEKKIKIALFSDVLKENLDGVTYTLFNIIKRVPKDKFDFLFITPYPPDDLENFPFPVYVCKYIRFPLYKDYPFAIPDIDKNLVKYLDQYKPDLIHYTTPALLGRYAVRYARSRKIPLTSTYHTHFKAYLEYYFKYFPGIKTLLHGLVKKIMHWFYNQTDMVFVPTTPILDELVDLGIQKERLMIWGRGIDTQIFNPKFRDSQFMDKLCGNNTLKILFVSRLVWEKEIKTLVRIYKKINKTQPNIKFVIAGNGPQRNYMEKRMPDAVFTGQLTGFELSRIYASSDMFIFPSITETFGNVVLEALASGLPVVAAAQGGPKGIIQNGKTGYLAVPKDIQDFYEKINLFINDEKHREEVSANALNYAITQNWDSLCDLLFKTYERIYIRSSMSELETNQLALQSV